MSATLSDIRAGIVANLQTIPNAQASEYMLSSPTPPTFEIELSETKLHEASQNGLVIRTLLVRGLVAYVADEGAQALMDTYLDLSGSTSVFAALESDRTLGGKIDYLIVKSISAPRQYSIPNVGRGSSTPQYLGAEWTVDVYHE